MEKEVKFTFGGVTDVQFEEAVQVVINYFNGISSTPITPEIEFALVVCGVHGMMLNMAHGKFLLKIKEYRAVLEKREQAENASQSNN